MEKLSIPKGTRDFGQIESFRRKYIIEKIQSNFIKYGFVPIETPTIEHLSVLTGKYGDEGDQLIFKILNSGDYLKKTNSKDYQQGFKSLLPKIAEKGLRYDLTVPFARYVVMNQHRITFPFKRYQIQPVWRADRPQKGRYREFYQCDADIIGCKSKWNEIELTLLIHDVFKSLNFDEFEIKINHREVLFAMAASADLKGKEIPFCVALDKIDKIGIENVLDEIKLLKGNVAKVSKYLKIITSSVDQSLKIKKLAAITDTRNKGFEELNVFFKTLNDITDRNFKISLDFSLARGLSYYTGLIYEVKTTKVKIGSICGGGRYDNLTGMFGLNGVSGIGISFGLDRIYDILIEYNLFPKTSEGGPKVLITHLDATAFKHGINLIDKIRNAGISADLFPEPVKIQKQMNYANKLKIPYVITVGSDEISQARYPLKNMISGKTLISPIESIIATLKTE